MSSDERAAAESDTPERDHVLVVDDSELVSTFVKSVLELAGYRVSTADEGGEALGVCREDPPAVVVTDLVMSPMSGRELIEKLQRSHPTIVTVVLTGYGTVERTVDLLKIGAFDVLTKPCREREITAAVEMALRHHKALDARDVLEEKVASQEPMAAFGKAAYHAAVALADPMAAVGAGPDGMAELLRALRTGQAEAVDAVAARLFEHCRQSA